MRIGDKFEISIFLFIKVIFLEYLVRTNQSNKSKYLSFISASVLSVLSGLTSSLLENILLGTAVFPMAEFSTVVRVVSRVLKSPEVIWL